MKAEKIQQVEQSQKNINERKTTIDIDFEIKPQIESVLRKLMEVGNELYDLKKVLHQKEKEFKKLVHTGELTGELNDEEANNIKNYLEAFEELEDNIKCLETYKDALNKLLEDLQKLDDEFTQMLLSHKPEKEN